MNQADPAASRITFISAPKPVNMAEEWFTIADLNHFWVRRRFEVAKVLLGNLIARQRGVAVAEIGCGNGLLQRQFEDQLSVEVDGFDLNLAALRANVSRRSRLFYYDIAEDDKAFAGRYDFLLLFDVIEHIEDDGAFLRLAARMLKPDGRVVINVPAWQQLYSRYDERAGHLRRYSRRDLTAVVQASGFRVKRWTYWGAPLIPLLLVRQRQLKDVPPERVIEQGFSPRNRWLNEALAWWAKLELVPGNPLGTSLMIVAEGA
ncbi:MAG: class I SAM-dependent methyltransferase [Verrucomicrobia bacterium]|nr:class I SAM-dependent methyltransferase [Verrucomicrobiota bacterium]